MHFLSIEYVYKCIFCSSLIYRLTRWLTNADVAHNVFMVRGAVPGREANGVGGGSEALALSCIRNQLPTRENDQRC